MENILGLKDFTLKFDGTLNPCANVYLAKYTLECDKTLENSGAFGAFRISNSDGDASIAISGPIGKGSKAVSFAKAGGFVINEVSASVNTKDNKITIELMSKKPALMKEAENYKVLKSAFVVA